MEIKEWFYLDKDYNLRYKKTLKKHGNLQRTIGDLVCWSASHGYKRVAFAGKMYLVHRIVWELFTGVPPKGVIDHKDGDPLNNHPDNLRDCSYSGNNRNQRIKPNNTSGSKNVYWNTNKKRWAVQLRTDHGRLWFGLHECLEFAELIAMEARDKYHGQFARNL